MIRILTCDKLKHIIKTYPSKDPWKNYKYSKFKLNLVNLLHIYYSSKILYKLVCKFKLKY